MSEKKAKKFAGHKRGGKKVVPVIFYAPTQVHRALKAKAKKLGKTQDGFLNALVARSVAAKPKKKAAPKVEPTAEAPIQ